MNILIDGLPTAIEVSGQICGINPDYQTGLKIIMAFEDYELVAQEKCAVLVQLLYKETPQNFSEAVRLGIKFLDCGEAKQEGSTGDGIRKYSFTHDARYIFAAVDRVLRGKLSKGEPVHWWEFVMAFMDLPEDCLMSRIIYLRAQHAKNKLTKEERQQYYEMQDILELPLDLTPKEQQIQDDFLRLLQKG